MSLRFWVLASVLCTVCAVAPRASAEGRRVVVLMPRALPARLWPEGTQSTIAELAAGNYQVLVQSSAADSLDELARELGEKGSAPGAAGALAIVQNGPLGIAYVWARRDEKVVELRTALGEGAVGEGAFALRVTEWIRTRDLPIPEGEQQDEPPAPKAKIDLAEPVVNRRAAHAAPTTRTGPLLWLGAGPVFSSQVPTPLVALNLGAFVPLYGVMGVEAGTSLSMLPLSLETRAGDVQLNVRHAGAHAVLELWLARGFAVAFGPGGGVVWIDPSSDPAPGFTAEADTTAVGVLSLRIRARAKTQSLNFLLSAEPGWLAPAIDVRASDESLVKLGRPWIAIAFGVGWSP